MAGTQGKTGIRGGCGDGAGVRGGVAGDGEWQAISSRSRGAAAERTCADGSMLVAAAPTQGRSSQGCYARRRARAPSASSSAARLASSSAGSVSAAPVRGSALGALAPPLEPTTGAPASVV